MSKVNRFGLRRKIPEDIKRRVRQRCGFGCVICGSSVYEYEHVSPTYVEAQRHDPDCIATLCASCHSKVTRRIWSKDKVSHASRRPASA